VSQLVSLIGIDRQHLHEYQSCHKKPTIRNVTRIADALNIKVDDLLGSWTPPGGEVS
jgi:DNA-binding phage protein